MPWTRTTGPGPSCPWTWCVPWHHPWLVLAETRRCCLWERWDVSHCLLPRLPVTEQYRLLLKSWAASCTRCWNSIFLCSSCGGLLSVTDLSQLPGAGQHFVVPINFGMPWKFLRALNFFSLQVYLIAHLKQDVCYFYWSSAPETQQQVSTVLNAVLSELKKNMFSQALPESVTAKSRKMG